MMKIINKIITITESPHFNDSVKLIVSSLKGEIKRSWFVNHAYLCLPLTIANQMGFVIKSLSKFSVIWDGTDAPNGVKVEILDNPYPGYQKISSHFGMGTVTIQNRFTFRTPPDINLMTINPPNHFIDGIHHMNGIIETDNLRRDFTFNLKVTRPNHKIIIEKGEYIGCIIPTPRYFIDGFSMDTGDSVLSNEEIEEERKAMTDFGIERTSIDKNKPHGTGRRYFKGEDVYGCPFLDHQKKIDK